MPRPTRCHREVGGLVALAIERCQAELVVCFDLLVEGDGTAAEAVAPEFFAVHRSLEDLRIEAQTWRAGSVPCALLRRRDG